MLKTVPIGNRAVFIRLEIRRLYCYDCGCTAQESIEQIASFKKHYTRKLEKYIHSLSSIMTIQDISNLLKMNWNTLWDIISRQLEKFVPRPRDLRKRQWIGIDEVSYKKGHQYLTVVVNHLTGRVVHVARGRGKQSIYAFFKRLKRLKAPLEVVSCDMWSPYLSVVNTHIVNNLNKAIDELRRKEFHLNKQMELDSFYSNALISSTVRQKKNWPNFFTSIKPWRLPMNSKKCFFSSGNAKMSQVPNCSSIVGVRWYMPIHC